MITQEGRSKTKPVLKGFGGQILDAEKGSILNGRFQRDRPAVVKLVTMIDYFVTYCERRGCNLDAVAEILSYCYSRGPLFDSEHVSALETIIHRSARGLQLEEQQTG